MKVKLLIQSLVFCLLINTNVSAQMNLVPNSSFEEINGKIKKEGQISLASGWSSPTEKKADLYSEKSKNDEFGIEENSYGKQDSKDDYNYAGILLWSYKEREKRSYLQAKLTRPLEAEKVYCIRFNVSLADMAKYACNNIGLYISAKKTTAKEILNYTIEPQIIHSKNTLFSNQDTWKAICNIYEATGNEQYITIGNFVNSDETEIKKMKRPSGFIGLQRTNAYYYVEDISVISMDSLEECVCEKVRGINKMNVVYHQNISENNILKAEKIIELKKIFFEYGISKVVQNSYHEMDKLIRILFDHQNIKLEIVGHIDSQERFKADETLAVKRAKVVYDYLTSKGVAKSRLSYKGVGSKQPLIKDSSVEGRAQNRRVGFVVK